MTVQYNQLVLTGGPGVFFKLLLKWRGCVFKLIYVDVLLFLVLYAIISCVYRFALPENLQRNFENLVIFIRNFQSMIPVAFILGFYIALIFSRFWHQFTIIPWGLKFAMALVIHLPGSDDRPRLLRRTCLRYVLGSLILTLTRINVVGKKRFPDFDSFINAAIFTEEEVRLLEEQQLHFQPFVPLVWTTSLITLAEKEKLIVNQHALVLLVTELNCFRQSLLNLFLMDYVCVPLVYTQVVTLSVYSYCIASLIGRQFIMDSSPLAKQLNLKDFYFPFFTVTEFIIYVGLLKVAETLVNPMGEDDEDFDINEIIDFNWKACWCIVDGMKPSPPAVVRDAYWRQSVVELPHTEESRKLEARPFRGSMFDIHLQGAPDLGGSMVSMSGIRSQDLPSHRPTISNRGSTAGTSGRPSRSSTHEHPVVDALHTEGGDHRSSTSSAPKLSPSGEQETDQPSSAFQFHGFTEPIEEEREDELESESQSTIGSRSADPRASVAGDNANTRQPKQKERTDSVDTKEDE